MSGLAMSVTGVILSVLSLALNPGINKLSIEPLLPFATFLSVVACILGAAAYSEHRGAK